MSRTRHEKSDTACDACTLSRKRTQSAGLSGVAHFDALTLILRHSIKRHALMYAFPDNAHGEKFTP